MQKTVFGMDPFSDSSEGLSRKIAGLKLRVLQRLWCADFVADFV